MPGQIKIDDGSGNYTILTNAGSLGSDKTITIPNETATLATTNGITGADIWNVTTSFSGDANPISSNWQRMTSDGAGYLGTGMSESSGIFTFPETGIWHIIFQSIYQTANSQDVQRYFSIINTTTNNSTYDIAALIDSCTTDGASPTGNQSGAITQFIFDVQDTTTHKCSFRVGSNNPSNVTNIADSNRWNIGAIFVRLGDT